MSNTVRVNAANLRKFLRLPADATEERVKAELAKPPPTAKREQARSTGDGYDGAQAAYYRQHFPELGGAE